MQSRPPQFARTFLLYVGLFSILLSPSIHAAGMDFALKFFKRTSTTNGIITTRSFNTMLGARDTNRLFTGTRLSPLGLEGAYLTIERGRVLRVGSNGYFGAEPSNGLNLNDSPRALTYDPTRTRAVLVTLGGEGFLYEHGRTNINWTTLASMHNVDLGSLAYHPGHDAYYGFRAYTGAPVDPTILLKYNAAGGLEKEIRLPAVPVNFGLIGATSELVSVGDALILLVEKSSFEALLETDKSYIYVIDPNAETMTLTYDGAVAKAPSIRFVAPAEGSTITVGQPRAVTVEVTDGNNDLRVVEISEGAESLWKWTFAAPGLGGTNRLTFNYLTSATGPHTLTARAQDGQNLVANAEPLHLSAIVPTPPPPALGVKITSPTNGMEFPLGAPIRLSAISTGASNISSVLFLNGSNVIATVTDLLPVIPPTFTFNWTTAPLGEIVVRAVGLSGPYKTEGDPVRIRVVAATAAVSAVRDLPETYLPGFGLNAKIVAVPNSAVNAWAVEERTPPGWQASSISHEGVFDAVNQKIKWGPFTDRESRTLTYLVKPPTNATGDGVFSGEVSVNGASSATTGDTTVRIVDLFHPADLAPQDSKITIDELTAYAAAWKTGAAWPRPPSPPILSYVTRAGFLWKNGESYRYQTNSQAPIWWAPLLPGKSNAPLARDDASGEVIRKLWPAFTPGRPVKVTLLARPTVGVSAYGVLEEIPAGWKIAEPGAASVVGDTLRFGPFFDAQERTFVYTVTPPADAITGDFGGQASFDGSEITIFGGGKLRRPAPAAELVDGHYVRLRFNATPGERFHVQTSEVIEGAPWTNLTVIEGAETPVELPLIETSEASRFYRLQPIAE